MKKPAYTTRQFGVRPMHPTASVIMVAYNSGDELFACLDSLQQQTDQDFEVILLNNGKELSAQRLAAYTMLYIDMDTNGGPSPARNVGATYARGSILLFLDDDAVTDKAWVACARQGLSADSNVVAVRGKVIPKQGTYRNRLAAHYDLGGKATEAMLDLEGNCAVRATAFAAVHGFNPELFGGEGLDLSYRLEHATSGAIRYIPDMIIHHNYVDSWQHFFNKHYRHGRNESRVSHQDPAVAAYKKQKLQYYTTTPKPDLVTRGILFFLYLLGKCAREVGKVRASLERPSE